MLSQENENEMEIGECCFCGGDCNPMSQSCGMCSRGISGAAIGIPVPEYLKKYVYKFRICDGCGDDKPLNLNTIENYEESSYLYCKLCLEKKDLDNMCEKCNKKIIGFTCEKDNYFMYICYDCKCDGKNCKYC